jgi:hypothetical protein
MEIPQISKKSYFSFISFDVIIYLKEFDARETSKKYSQKFVYKHSGINERFGSDKAGIVPPTMIRDFFRTYHEHLHNCGVDGVKVDNQVQILAYYFDLQYTYAFDSSNRVLWKHLVRVLEEE